jgi:uncharacterized peroxidase-related enzyme
MPRIAPIHPSTATADVDAQLAISRKLFGGTPNLVTTAANSPAALRVMLSMFSQLGAGTFSPRQVEQIALAVAQNNGCGYCLSAHTAVGKMHGLTPADLAAARNAQATDPKTAAMLSLAIAINTSRGHVTDATLDAARAAGLSDGDIVEVVAHIALNVFTNYLNSVAETAIDFPEVSLAAA